MAHVGLGEGNSYTSKRSTQLFIFLPHGSLAALGSRACGGLGLRGLTTNGGESHGNEHGK